MFHKDFFPTPSQVIQRMLDGENIQDKIILEPSAGKGDIVDYLTANGAKTVLACEINSDLQKIIKSKCMLIAEDFLTLRADQISHIDVIVMNPPFSADEKHILHAYEIAPAGCRIIALCNLNTVERPTYEARERLVKIVEDFGGYEDIGDCFTESERTTQVDIALIKITKPGQNYSQEFDGFFMDEDPIEAQEIGLMPYNVVRDLVQRYTEAIKIFDRQLEEAKRMNDLTGSFFSSTIAMSITSEDAPKTRNEFKKSLQKSGWLYIFDKLNMQKYSTQGLKADINKFVETQEKVPFTRKNIYAMLQIIIGTKSQRMDKAMIEVFDKVTEHHHDNRYRVEGWKTNSHYLVNRRFIFPYGAEFSKWSPNEITIKHTRRAELLTDMEKTLCYLTGDNYDIIKGINNLEYKLTPGQWYETHFFKVRGYKKGTIHVEFTSEDVWGRFNQRVAKIKGFPLYEYKKPTKPEPKAPQPAEKKHTPVILFEIKLKKTA